MGNAPLQRAERERRARRARETARFRPPTARPRRGLDVRGLAPYEIPSLMLDRSGARMQRARRT